VLELVGAAIGAVSRTVLEASGSLAMKSPCRSGSFSEPSETTGPPPAERVTVHLESRAVPLNSSDCGRQEPPLAVPRSIANVTEPGGSWVLPDLSRERYSTVWLPSPLTVNLLTNGEAFAVLLSRTHTPPSTRCSVQSTPVPVVPSVALSVTSTGFVYLVAGVAPSSWTVVVGATASVLTATLVVLLAFSPSA
jgi:hypothetical protein